MGGGKSTPSAAPPPEPTPVPTYEEQGEPASDTVRSAESRRLRAKRGAQGNVLTSPMGTATPTLGGKSVLGG